MIRCNNCPDAEQCLSCKMAEARLLIPPPPPPPRRTRYQGPTTPCTGCKGNVRLKISPIETRHLCYHLWPAKDNNAWRWNLDQLVKRWEVFNGRKIIAVATDQNSHSLAEVQTFLNRADVEWLEIPNDTVLGQVVTWVPLWEKLNEKRPGHATFYAHGKGTSHRGRSRNIVTLRWAKAMYEVNLDYLPLLEKTLRRYTIAGIFRTNRAFFSGNFYWVRNPEFYKKKWRMIGQHYAGTELWADGQYSKSEAGCLTYDQKIKGFDLYTYEYWLKTLGPELEKWKAAATAEQPEQLLEGELTSSELDQASRLLAPSNRKPPS